MPTGLTSGAVVATERMQPDNRRILSHTFSLPLDRGLTRATISA
jgi:hypothetical protein